MYEHMFGGAVTVWIGHVRCLDIGMVGACVAEPELAGKPLVIVSGRDVVEISRGAADAGIKPGLRVNAIRQICPHVVIRRFSDHCHEIGEQIDDVLREYGDIIERDVSERTLALHIINPEDGQMVVKKLVADIYDLSGVHAIAGLSRHRFFARVAAGSYGDSLREHGVAIVSEDSRWVNDMPVTEIPVPRSVQDKLLRLGLKTVGDIKQVDRTMLYKMIGSHADVVVCCCQGGSDVLVPASVCKDKISQRAVIDGGSSDKSVIFRVVSDVGVAVAKSLRSFDMCCHKIELCLDWDDDQRVWCRKWQVPVGDERKLINALIRLCERGIDDEKIDMVVSVEVIAQDLVPVQTEQMKLMDMDERPSASRVKVRSVMETRRELMLELFDPLRGAGYGSDS